MLDVLSKMGYGDLRQDAVVHTGKSGDEGIDGRINQDALDSIKCWFKRSGLLPIKW